MKDNFTCKDHDAMHHLHLVWNVGVLVVALPLNLTALGIFLCAYRLRTVVTIYMANLAACDLLFALALPLRIYYYATHRWALGDLPCRLAGSLFLLNLYGSCLFLACVNVDRLLALAFPLRARHLRRPQGAWLVCAAVWALIVLGSVPVALAHDTSKCQGANGTTEVRCFESFSPGDWKNELLPLLALAEIVGFLLPLAVVLWCSAHTLHALHTTRRLSGRGLRPAALHRAVRLLLLNVLIFVVCFVPYNLVLAAYGLTKANVVASTQASRASLRQALQFTMLLTCTNCLLDPLVYYFTTEGFRNTLTSRRGRTTAGRSERGPRDTERHSVGEPPDLPRVRLSLEQEATSPAWETQALRGRGSCEWGESVI